VDVSFRSNLELWLLGKMSGTSLGTSRPSFKFIGFDELTPVTETQKYRYLFSRLRRLEGLKKYHSEDAVS